MTKAEVLIALHKGKKVRHESFTSDEWMRETGGGFYQLEDDVKCSPNEFWKWRKGDMWSHGWDVVEPKESYTREELVEVFCNSAGGNHIHWIYERLMRRFNVESTADFMIKLKKISDFIDTLKP